MSNHTEVEVLLVEDSPCDAEMTLRTLHKRHLANSIVHVKDGQEALDWLLGTVSHAGRDAQASRSLNCRAGCGLPPRQPGTGRSRGDGLR
ncbi:MAG: hypothetical protein JNN07_23095 [Verrucomicrobiales bacterium]|nr:hypothetical protein [Verrucomicrobiales bacterium]